MPEPTAITKERPMARKKNKQAQKDKKAQKDQTVKSA